jgi:hypothetical protein
MKYFLDTEFDERGPEWPLGLVSIALVAEDGRVFHADVEGAQVWANPWLKKNVIPHLSGPWTTTLDIATGILRFLRGDDHPEFWGYYCDYDWVVFCQLFGDMSTLPTGFPYYCRDLRQALDDRGFTHVKQDDDATHHALSDAQWIAKTWRRWILPAVWQSDFGGKWWARQDGPAEPGPTPEESGDSGNLVTSGHTPTVPD